MILSENLLEHGYWEFKREPDFPPAGVIFPEEYRGGSRLNLIPTQTTLSDYQQRKLVSRWCRLLPNLAEVRNLWINTRVNQALFEAFCEMSQLESLYIKWGRITDLSPVAQLSNLRYLHIGSAPSIPSIEPLAALDLLVVLHIQNFKLVRDLEPLTALTALEGLAVHGDNWTVRSFSPLGCLRNLRYLFLWNLKARDGSLSPLFQLINLVSLQIGPRWSKSEMRSLRTSLPDLRYSTLFDDDMIERFGDDD